MGPGTGAFTRPILESLRPGDRFDIVEINPMFCRQLEDRLISPFRNTQPGVEVHLHRCPIEDADIPGDYGHIVCGLPFNNFEPALVRSIFRRMIDLLAPGGDLTYFEYAAVRSMRAPREITSAWKEWTVIVTPVCSAATAAVERGRLKEGAIRSAQQQPRRRSALAYNVA